MIDIPHSADLDRLIGYAVRDRDDDKVGTVTSVFADTAGRPTFLGVNTGWLGLGRSHLIPARLAQVNDAAESLRVPYDRQQIKDAPAFDQDQDIDYASECSIYDHFGLEQDAADAPTAAAPAEPAETAGEQRIPLAREDVTIGTRRVEAGGVRLRKIVRTETVNRPVELRHEEVVIERVPASGSASGSAPGGAGEEIWVPLWREEPVVQRTSAITEEVVVRKEDRIETRDVAEEVRREDVEVERDVRDR